MQEDQVHVNTKLKQPGIYRIKIPPEMSSIEHQLNVTDEDFRAAIEDGSPEKPGSYCSHQSFENKQKVKSLTRTDSIISKTTSSFSQGSKRSVDQRVRAKSAESAHDFKAHL